MPIFDQGYQHWNGALAGHAWRWTTIARQGVRIQFRKRGMKWMVASAFAPSLALAAVLVIWGLLEQGSSLLDSFQFLIQSLPEEIRAGPKGYRSAFWTWAFDVFFRIQTFFSMILVLFVGPNLISQDLRFNAIPLYFSRPLTRLDYFAGKLGVIGFFLAMVTVVPATAAWLLGLAFSFELSVFRDTGRILLASIAYGLILTLSAGTLMLAFSSLSRNSRIVALIFFAFWILTSMASGVLEETIDEDRDPRPYWRVEPDEEESRPDWTPIVSYMNNLSRTREVLLGTVAARDQFLGLIARAQSAANDVAREAARRAVPFGGLMRRNRPLESEASREVVLPPPPPPLRLQADRYPWTWAAAPLLGLFAISGLILTTRVKSLDRLK